MRASVLRGGRMVCRICGSDQHFARHGDEMLAATAQMGGMPGTGGSVDLGADVFMGHEFGAEILEAGPDTEAPPPGTLVTSVPVLLSQPGMEMIVYSNSTLGGYAERMVLSAPLLLPLPNGLDVRPAALTEPMAVGLHAVNKSGITRGTETIVASDFSPKRRELATAVGAIASSTTCCAGRRGAPASSSRGCACSPTRSGRSSGSPRRSRCSSCSATTPPSSPPRCGRSPRARWTWPR